MVDVRYVFQISGVRDKMHCAVFLWYKKCRCAPMGAVNFLYDLNILKYIEFLFERDFMYAWNRKGFHNGSASGLSLIS